MGNIPAFRGADGLDIFGPDELTRYISESGPFRDQLLSHGATERALIRQSICMANNDYVEPM